MRQAGATVPEIASALGIAKSTAFIWCRSVVMTSEMRSLIPHPGARAGNRFGFDAAERRRSEWRREAEVSWMLHHCEPLFTLGIGLYWGEGGKRWGANPHGVRLEISNSDPGLIATWLKWCQAYIPDVPLHLRLFVHDGVDHQCAKAFWRQELDWQMDIPVYTAVSTASRRTLSSGRLPNGTAAVRAGRGAAEAACKMLHWIRLIRVNDWDQHKVAQEAIGSIPISPATRA
jgi:hypothetical protein